MPREKFLHGSGHATGFLLEMYVFEVVNFVYCSWKYPECFLKTFYLSIYVCNYEFKYVKYFLMSAKRKNNRKIKYVSKYVRLRNLVVALS